MPNCRRAQLPLHPTAANWPTAAVPNRRPNGLLFPMKSKHSATELKRLALDGALAACEARAFAAYHAATLDVHNHTEYVEAFVLQLGAPSQHGAILALLAGVERDFRAGKIAYKPPDAALLTSVLDVGRWVTRRLECGLAHAALLDRARRGDAGS